jgi:uncharacterized membrane protein
MPNLVVMTFGEEAEAGEALAALRAAHHEHGISLDDTAVVVKAADGTVEVKNEVDRGIKIGAVGGGLLGLLAGFVLGGPIGSLVVGAVGGALSGDLANLGIEPHFVDDVSNGLKPGSSALFLMVREADPAAVFAALEPFEGEVYDTHLPPEAEAALRRALE